MWDNISIRTAVALSTVLDFYDKVLSSSLLRWSWSGARQILRKTLFKEALASYERRGSLSRS